jgi:hypothetical protein
MRPVFVLVGLLITANSAASQTDPIRCWWRTTRGAVAIGETFDATLTCAIREQETSRTVPDESRLAAAVVHLTPFEVLDGSHPADLRSATHRFFQYHYTLRIIDRDVIGRDAKFPDLQIAYRVQSLANGEWIAGRDRTYTLPGQSIRVLALVPLDATDIRDSEEAGFAEVEALRFRARMLELAAYVLLVLGVLIAIPALWRLTRARTAAGEPPGLSRRILARAVDTELAAVAHESGGGWTPDLTARALAATRLAAAGALERDIASQPLDGSSAGDGRLRVTSGRWRPRRMGASSSLTPPEIRAAIARATDVTATRREALATLANTIETLASALYRETFTAGTQLDEALNEARSAIRRLRQR